jgi:predicted hotdog family 3-hydroxylacyl-ACP dehydratase
VKLAFRRFDAFSAADEPAGPGTAARHLAFLAGVIELPIVQHHLPLLLELRVAVEQRLRLTRVAGIFRCRVGRSVAMAPTKVGSTQLFWSE